MHARFTFLLLDGFFLPPAGEDALGELSSASSWVEWLLLGSRLTGGAGMEVDEVVGVVVVGGLGLDGEEEE